MANKAITLLSKDDPSNTMLSIIDAGATIDSLWTTASTTVDGYMDFTSVGLGYARQAKLWTVYQVSADGNFIKGETATSSFDLGFVDPGYVQASVPMAGATVVELALLVNQIRLDLINAGIVRQAAA